MSNNYHLLGSQVGAWSDGPTDYDYGEKQVLQLVQYHSALGRPKAFEAAVQAVYASYEKAKTSLGIAAKWYSATAMKQVGADASRLMAEMQQARGDSPIAVPSGGASDVYRPQVDAPEDPWWKFRIPWWVWGAGGLAAAWVLWPMISPVVLGALAARRVGAAGMRLLPPHGGSR